MRMIDADAALEIFQGLTELAVGEGAALVKALIFAGLKSRSVTPTVGGWISVDDRLPNSNGFYIVWRPHFYPDFGMPAICYFDGTDTWHDSYGVDYSRTLCSNAITHWMPLPEPPKEEDDA